MTSADQSTLNCESGVLTERAIVFQQFWPDCSSIISVRPVACSLCLSFRWITLSGLLVTY